MNDPSNIDMNAGMTNAVSIVENSTEEFPVLKAFQQYIDAEQSKARKRMLALCIFFGCLMTVVIVVFLILLNGINMRNQALNDRLIEYAMKDRDRQSAVVVQPSTSDSSTMFLASKIEEMQKKLEEAQKKSESIEKARQEEAARAATEAAVKAAKEKARIKEELEIARLKAELFAEREKAAAEREKKHQEEIEAYRRKYYPELYGQTIKSVKKKASVEDDEEKVDQEIDALLDDLNDEDAIRYFDEEDEDGNPIQKKSPPKTPSKPARYTIPIEVKGSRSKWLIPND